MNRVSPPLIASIFLLSAPRSAEACGGLFCDGPMPMPVDQRGEDILFVLDGPTVEVHIRIEYTGEPARFAWIVPLQAVPEVSVGSEPLFDAMLNAAGPNWRTNTQYDCDEDNPFGNTGLTTMGFVPSSDFGGGGPSVVFEATVGAFDVVVLQGGTAQELIEFLTANDYAQDPESEPIVQEYLDDGFLFAAVKLTDNAGVDAIHPLVFRFPGDEPCVPIRLTRIAAEEDMGIRTYFLGTERWVPSNYMHVELNPLAFNWQFFSPENYFELLAAAVDEAGGQAFATDYVGPSDKVDTSNVYSSDWSEAAFIGLDPILAIGELYGQGLMNHPLISSLLYEFIPPPVDENDPLYWWDTLGNHPEEIDLSAWDDVAFSAALAERIIVPGMHAADLVETWPKLTRLSTSMSPEEMTLDPTFHTNGTLPDVDHTSIVTVEQVQCGGNSVYHVDYQGADRPVCVFENFSYPEWDDMPASIWSGKMPMVGGPQIVDDNSEVIDQVYYVHQQSTQCASGGDGDSESGDGGTSSGWSSGSTDGFIEDMGDAKCGCSTERGAAPLGIALGVLVLGLIGPWRRRD